LDDLKQVGNIDLQAVVKRKRSETLLMRKVWMRNYGFFRLMSYSVRRGLFKVYLKSLLREKKWRTFFPLKKLMSRRTVQS